MATLHFLNALLLALILGQEFDFTSSSYVTLEMGGLVHSILGNGITVSFFDFILHILALVVLVLQCIQKMFI